MDYTITIFKKTAEPLYALWIDMPDAEPQPGVVWQEVQAVELTMEEPIPAVLRGQLLTSAATNDRLFLQITDTWLGPVNNDLLDSYHLYTSQEEAREILVDTEPSK